MATSAQAAPSCTDFFYNMDGTWSPTHPIMMAGPTSETTIGPGEKFRRGMPGLGGRLGFYLDTHCPNMRLPVGRSIPRVP
jgi:hypothetical protein